MNASLPLHPVRLLPAFFFALALGLPGLAAQDRTLPASPDSPASAAAPAINASLPTVFVVGDSTAANGSPAAPGWGRPFATYFDPAKVNIVNRARGGRSSRTYLTEGSWDQVVAGLSALVRRHVAGKTEDVLTATPAAAR